MFKTILARVFDGKKSRDLPIAPGVLLPPWTWYKLNGRTAYTFGGWQVLIWCPYCMKQHVHGGCPKIKDLVPTRKSNCYPGGEYVLEVRGVE